MPYNRLETLATLYISGTLRKEDEAEFLTLLDDPGAREYLSRNQYTERILEAINPPGNLEQQVLHIIQTTQGDFEESVLKRIEEADEEHLDSITGCPLNVIPSTKKTYKIQRSLSEEISSPFEVLPTQRKRKNPNTLWAAALAIAASLVVLLIVSFLVLEPAEKRSLPIAQLHDGEGGAITILRGTERLSYAKEKYVYERDILLTGVGSTVQVSYLRKDNKQTTLALYPNTHLVFAQNTPGKTLMLESGALTAEVAPQKNPMRLKTPSATATVLGTRFLLHVKREATRLEVTKGKVQFESANSGGEHEAQLELIETNEYAMVRDTSAGAPKMSFGDFKIEADRPVGTIDSVIMLSTETGLPIPTLDPIPPEALIVLDELPSLYFSIEANVFNARNGSMRFTLVDSGGNIVVDQSSNLGLSSEPLSGWNQPSAWNLEPGEYVLTASLYSDGNLEGDKDDELKRILRIIE